MIQETSTDIFVHRQNLEHYRRLLAEPDVANDPVRHKSIIRLLADEEAKETKSHEQR
jgi:hypothetical protein